jgi:ribosomal protein S18 acetylase RimI-like enzyme
MLRLASERDIDFLVGIHNVSFETERITRKEFIMHLRSNRSRVMIDEDVFPIGYCIGVYLFTSKRARLYSVGVLPDNRRKGILLSFLEDFERDARQNKLDELFLEVEEDNHGALSVYKRFGFEQYGIFPKYYENGKDAIRLKKLCTLA